MKWIGVSLAAVVFAVVTVVAQQSSSSAEQQIRAQIRKYDTNTAPGSNRQLYTKDAVVWSNAYSKPHTMDESLDSVRADLQAAPGRRNQVSKTTPSRIVMSKNGDMAYEYSTFHLTFDDERGHSDFDGALLRVWQLQNGQWLIAAEFRRPYGRVAPTAGQKPGE